MGYELAWRLPPVGLRAAWRPLALVIGLALYVELLFLFGRLVQGVPANSLLEDLMVFAGAWAVWTGAGWILLAGRVRLRLIAAGGLLTAVGFATLRRLSAVYLPNLVATVVGAVLADDPGRLGRFIRTPRG